MNEQFSWRSVVLKLVFRRHHLNQLFGRWTIQVELARVRVIPRSECTSEYNPFAVT